MPVDRRRILVLAACAAVAVPRIVRAARYPTRPVRVLVGFPAGGGADILTRIVCDWLQGRLGQPFVVENRPGAATNLATEAVVRAPADGHTLLATTTSNLLNGALYPGLPYDFLRDIASVAGIATQPLVLAVNPALRLSSVEDLVAHARQNPGALNLANFGEGTISHLAGMAFALGTRIEVASVPYRGSPPMLADLLAGRVQAAFDNLPGIVEFIRAGRLQALAVTTTARTDALPGVPALGEFVPGYEAFTVAGIGAPSRTPAEVIETLNSAINAGLADPVMRRRLAALGSNVLAGSPGDFAELVVRESRRWEAVIRASGFRLN